MCICMYTTPTSYTTDQPSACVIPHPCPDLVSPLPHVPDTHAQASEILDTWGGADGLVDFSEFDTQVRVGVLGLGF